MAALLSDGIVPQTIKGARCDEPFLLPFQCGVESTVLEYCITHREGAVTGFN